MQLVYYSVSILLFPCAILGDLRAYKLCMGYFQLLVVQAYTLRHHLYLSDMNEALSD